MTRLLYWAALASCSCTAASVTPVRPEVPESEIGINVAPSNYYNTERTFANLARGTGGWKDPSAGWGELADAQTSARGFPLIGGAALSLNPPQAVWAGKATAVVCTWTGDGQIQADGDAHGWSGGKKLAFTWPGFNRVKGGRPSVVLYVKGVTASAPFDNLDCREPGLKTVGIFDARYVDDLRPYKVLRFLDWSSTNGNPAAVTWATRSTPERGGSDGSAIETMVDLANAAGSDAWFTVPWNADEGYVRRMSELVRDRLDKSHCAYFELSNEVWNFQFGVATQAMNEGLAAVPPLSTDKYTNNPLRLAQKSIWFHKITTDVFKASPARLVRVIATQNDNSWTARTALGFPGVADWIDALATAPYFGHGFFNAPNDKVTVEDLPALFGRLEVARAATIAMAIENKAVAGKYGKRYIAYEAGQHLIAPTGALTPVMEAMQRSPQMGVLYDRFLADWKAKIGDTITLYSATGTISQYGAWGLREYAGQPIGKTPKRRAVLDAIAKH